MPKTYTQQELTERYEKLPDALKDAMFSTEVAEKIFETGKKHGLTIEKIGFLAEETGRVILGLTRPSELVAILAERLSVAPDAAQKIASDINHQIFFPLREILKTTHQVDVGEAAIQRGDQGLGIQKQGTAHSPPATAPIDLRSAPRPAASSPVHTPTMFLGTEKVPPINLRKQDLPGRTPLVDIGDIAISTPQPAHFLTREEAEKVVAEKKITAQPPPPTPPAPPIPMPAESLGAMTSKLETDLESGAPSIRAAEPKTSPTNSYIFPQAKKQFSTIIPLSSPQPHDYRGETSIVQNEAKPAPQPKVPPIDLRRDREVEPAFVPPAPIIASRPTPPAPPPTATPMPAAKQETPPPPAPMPSKIPLIDLRTQTARPPMPIKTKPWSGADPYKEPIE